MERVTKGILLLVINPTTAPMISSYKIKIALNTEQVLIGIK